MEDKERILLTTEVIVNITELRKYLDAFFRVIAESESHIKKGNQEYLITTIYDFSIYAVQCIDSIYLIEKKLDSSKKELVRVIEYSKFIKTLAILCTSQIPNIEPFKKSLLIMTKLISKLEDKEYHCEINEIKFPKWDSLMKKLLSQKRNEKIKEIQIKNLPEPIETHHEQYDHIFGKDGFSLFDYLMKNFANINHGQIADIIFMFHSLSLSKHIRVNFVPFRDWFNEIYSEEKKLLLDQSQTYNSVNTESRMSRYQNTLSLYQSSNTTLL